MKARIIAVGNHKGGFGKTCTVANLGSILSQRGYKVLLIDLDAQANLTTSLAEPTDGVTIYEATTGKVRKLPVVVVTNNLHLVPSSLTFAMVDLELFTAIAREHILSECLIKIIK